MTILCPYVKFVEVELTCRVVVYDAHVLIACHLDLARRPANRQQASVANHLQQPTASPHLPAAAAASLSAPDCFCSCRCAVVVDAKPAEEVHLVSESSCQCSLSSIRQTESRVQSREPRSFQLPSPIAGCRLPAYTAATRRPRRVVSRVRHRVQRAPAAPATRSTARLASYSCGPAINLASEVSRVNPFSGRPGRPDGLVQSPRGPARLVSRTSVS